MPIRCPNPACAQIVNLTATPPAVGVACPRCGRRFRLASPAATSSAAGRTLPVPAADKAPPETLDLGTVPPSASDTRRPADDNGLPARIGRFAIRERLGEGAFGVVYRAHDPQLDREVALKVAKPEQMGSARRVQRFLREARAAANLRHPHIVPVFDSGGDGGQYYIASAFIPGRSLADAVEESPDGLEPRRAAEVVRRLAEALAYAHGKGVVHRDVKPANVLLDEHGEPLLADFGLAAREEGGERLTQEGARCMGTPAYMAPEQAAGDAVAASDQYSLGCTLYELLTGRTPFEGPPEIQLFLHQGEEPPAPRKLRRSLPRDLETVCLKALAKKPGDRYRDCRALADDLGRFLDGEPVQASQVGTAERLVKWARRRPALASAYALALLTLVLGGLGVGATGLWQRAEGARREAATARDQLADEKGQTEAALGREQQAKQQLAQAHAQLTEMSYRHRVQLAYRAWHDHQVTRARTILDQCPAELRGWEWRYVRRLCHAELMTLDGHLRAIHSVAYRPDGKQIASSSPLEDHVRLWDATTGREQCRIQGLPDGVHSLVYSPDGRFVAGSGGRQTEAGEVKLWDAQTGEEVRTLRGHSQQVWGLAFSPDGSRLASASCDRGNAVRGEIKLWDIRTGRECLTIKSRGEMMISLAFSPNGRHLVGGGFLSGADSRRVGCIKVWESGSGQELFRIDAFQYPVQCVACSPDGKLLASGTADHMNTGIGGEVKLWSAETGREFRSMAGHFGGVMSASFSPDGRRLATAGSDRLVRVWDVGSGQELFRLKGHRQSVNSVAFSLDGSRLVSGDGVLTEPGQVKVWRADRNPEVLTLPGYNRGKRTIAFDPGGTRLAGVGQDGTIAIWDPSAGKKLASPTFRLPRIEVVRFSPDGKRLALVGGQPRHAWLWDLRQAQVSSAPAAGELIAALAYSPDGQLLATGGAAYDAQGKLAWAGWRLWEAPTGRILRTVSDPGFAPADQRLVFSPDGRLLAATTRNKQVKVWEAREAKEASFTLVHSNEGMVEELAFSPDGAFLATAGLDQAIRFWDVRSGRPVRSLLGHAAPVCGLAFSPDGARLASGDWDGNIILWDARSGEEMLLLKGHGGRVTGLTFSPDGSKLASNSWDGTIKVWDATEPDARREQTLPTSEERPQPPTR